MNINLIHVIITGGTIDSFYNGIKDSITPNTESIIPRFITNLRLQEQFQFTTICMKDSRELTNEDRKNIMQAIEESKATRILVTHGTYTLPDTARYLKANLKRNDQTIILTASMIPLDGFNLSDAPFNLGYAISKLQDLESGIYVGMNGHIFAPEEVIKNLSEGKFSSIFNK